MAGRWMFALQFRRPGMICFNHTWQFASGNKRSTFTLVDRVREKFLLAIMLSPLFYSFLGAGISGHIMASDASITGGAVGESTSLEEEGADFLLASRKVARDSSTGVAPIVILSLFNGIGGAFQAYDIAGVEPLARIAVERYPDANRVTTRRWPGTVIIDDVHKLNSELFESWARTYTRAEEVHLWAGWPCVDLSRVKANRLNLDGENSGLFWLLPEILEKLRIAFGDKVKIKHVLITWQAWMKALQTRSVTQWVETHTCWTRSLPSPCAARAIAGLQRT